jgi:hypothetical protein
VDGARAGAGRLDLGGCRLHRRARARTPRCRLLFRRCSVGFDGIDGSTGDHAGIDRRGAGGGFNPGHKRRTGYVPDGGDAHKHIDLHDGSRHIDRAGGSWIEYGHGGGSAGERTGTIDDRDGARWLRLAGRDKRQERYDTHNSKIKPKLKVEALLGAILGWWSRVRRSATNLARLANNVDRAKIPA